VLVAPVAAVVPPVVVDMPGMLIELPAVVPLEDVPGWLPLMLIELVPAVPAVAIDIPGMSTISSPDVAVAACAGVNIVCTDSMSSSTLYDAVDCVCITSFAFVWVPASTLPPRPIPAASANASAAPSVPRVMPGVPMLSS